MATIWPTGGGELGARMRELDWSASPLGSPETWPISLRSVVSLMLNSKFPMFVAWGAELGFIYNDAYAEILGEKHPRALGQRFRDIWAEIWPDVSPLADAAMRGEATYREDLPLLMNRYGFDEQTWFTFSYSPVEDEGRVMGVFCACVETTSRVRDAARRAFLVELDEQLRDLENADEILLTSATLLGRHLGGDRAHWAEVDADNDRFDVLHEWTRSGVSGFGRIHRLSDFGAAVVAQMSAGGLAAIEDVAAASSAPGVGETRGALSVPLLRGGVWQSAFCVHTLQPRRWREDELQLIREVAERAWTRAERAKAEARVRHSEERFRALVSATSNVTFRVNADFSQLLEFNGRTITPDDPSTVSSLAGFLPVQEQERVQEAIAAALARGDLFQLEHHIGPRGGDIWIRTWAAPLRDARGDIMEWFGTATDVTQAHKARQELEETAERLQLATEAAEVGFWDYDVVADVLIWPPRVKQMFGISDDAPISIDDFYAGLHPADVERVTAAFAAARDPAKRAVYDVEYRTIGKEDGRLRWVAAKGRGIFNGAGECVRLIGTAIDISVRKAAEEHLRLMVNELNHRVKNSLATVQAITAQTLRPGVAPKEVREALVSRLVALAEAHDVLTDEKWSGADLGEIAGQAAAPYVGLNGASPIEIEGPTVFLPPKTAIAMALAFHELATNAAKYGALSTPSGRVSLSWSVRRGAEERVLHLVWRERGGPEVRPPERAGFGTRLIQRGLASELRGAVHVDYAPAGVVCNMEARLPHEQLGDWQVDLQLS